jgi:hypothetical protein
MVIVTYTQRPIEFLTVKRQIIKYIFNDTLQIYTLHKMYVAVFCKHTRTLKITIRNSQSANRRAQIQQIVRVCVFKNNNSFVENV